ncbi:MAG: TonB-dependent receptor, partial [Pseudomonadota bacterium]|nr:TonB-dependent receptor [Pseudomonadota bacterium]
LRGPLAQLYGNAAGGVVQVFTQDDAAQPTTSLSIVGGSYGLWKVASTFSTSTPGYGLTLGASWFQTDGWREHSAAERGQFNGRWQSDLTPTLHASVVVNSIDQPVSLDPAGLTRAQWQSNPRQTAAVVVLQDARKSVHQTQIGNVEEWRIDDNTSATARLYVGQRDLDNALSTPLSAQLAPTSSGGIVSFARAYFGTGLLVSHRIPLDAGRAIRVVGGLDYDRLYENRQGYIDNAGVQGALKRDERNVVDARGLFAQAAWDFATAWTLTAGVRHSSVRFSSDDRFITATNPDDSGGVNYAATNPVAGMSWRATSTLNVYANVGRGFETPTFTELAYQPNATGLNFGLRASHSRHAELGLKWKLSEQQRLDVAFFDVGTRDEIVVDTNDGGRSTYKNASRTTRRGVEASYVTQLGESVHATLSYTQLQARFRDGFASGDGASAVQVAAGNRLPGVASRNGFAELAWQPRTAWGGFTLAAELIHTGKIYASDANDDAAASATVFNVRSSLAQEFDRWKITELLRLDNATDKRYAGSVIVNDANKRYFEPALPRNWLLGITARHEFD